MAVTTGGLMSLGASGTLAKTLTFSSWRGRKYVRSRVVPANPKTTGQVSVRSVFYFLQAVWKEGGSDFVAPWNAFIKGRPLTNRNAFTQANAAALEAATTLATLLFSKGAGGGLAPVLGSITPGSGQLAVAMTVPAAPTGWTLTESIVGAILDQDPHSPTSYVIKTATASTSPWTCTVTGLTSSVLYRVGAWLKWTKPDGTFAYSVSVLGSGTPS